MADTKKTVPGTLLEPEAAMSDWQRALKHVQENPLLYAVGLIVVVLVAALGGIFTLTRTLAEREYLTRYATALDNEDASTRAAELEVIADFNDDWGTEAAYMMAEEAIRAGEPEKARETFEEIVARAPESRYAPRAAEGLAYLSEAEGDLNAALAGYQEVADRWQESFEGRIQHMNIARVLEKQEKLPEAIEHLNQQIEIFPESRSATRAGSELARLKEAHPDLFPADEPEESSDADAESEDAATDDATDTAEETADEVVEEATEEASELTDTVEEAVEEAAQDAGEMTEEAVDETVETVSEAVETAVEAVEVGAEALAEEAEEVAAEIVEEATEAVDTAADAAEAAVDAAAETVEEAVDAVQDEASEASEAAEATN